MQFDADDPRFSAIFSSHLYNIDQSDPNFKKTEAFDQILNRRKEKAARMVKDEKSAQQFVVEAMPQSKSWTSLVDNVKDKTSGEWDRKRLFDNKKPTNVNSKFNTNKKFKR